MRFYLRILSLVALAPACSPDVGSTTASTGGTTELVFAYGTLKPNHERQQQYLHCWADGVQGELHAVKNAAYPGAIGIGTAASTFTGFVMEIPASRLPTIDQIEGAPSLYARLKVVTTGGRAAWIYQYNHPTNLEPAVLTAWEPEKDRPELCD